MTRGHPLHTMGSGGTWASPDVKIIHFGSPVAKEKKKGKKKDRYADVVEPKIVGVRQDNGELVSLNGEGWAVPVPHPLATASVEDVVNHPKHYTSDPSGVECIQITRHRNFNIGNAIKYLWRNGLKDDPSQSGLDKQIEDLRKAVFYIEDEITRLSELTTTES